MKISAWFRKKSVASLLMFYLGVIGMVGSVNGLAIDWKGRPESTNVIDLRKGVPCDNPRNCVAGFTGACNFATCQQPYNTGYCTPELSPEGVRPGLSCKTVPAKCEEFCLPMQPKEDVKCSKLNCQEREGNCDPITGVQDIWTGNCDLIPKWSDGDTVVYTEICHSEKKRCTVEPDHETVEDLLVKLNKRF